VFAGHLDLSQPLMWTVPNALSPEQCDHYLERFQSQPPVRGTALLFQHRVLHAARGVTSGVKYALRTDLLYRAR
jgi:ectoine hydroxylase-related dioxygenase (phytanoyl-CoA dioxygenase family)